jgi:hypothetical protein
VIRGGKKPSCGTLNRFPSSRSQLPRCADSFAIVKAFQPGDSRHTSFVFNCDAKDAAIKRTPAIGIAEETASGSEIVNSTSLALRG